MNILWNKILEKLAEEISAQNINTWLKPIKLKKIENNFIEAEVPNKVNLSINNSLKKTEYKKIFKENTKIINDKKFDEIEHSNINPKYTFETFVIGL